MTFHYVGNIRLPTEKAHGLQITQNCEALAKHFDLTLYPARRYQPPELRAAPDAWTFYSVARNFDIDYIPCIDLLGSASPRLKALFPLFFDLQIWSYNAALSIRLRRAAPNAIYYSRAARTLMAFSHFKPPRRMFWEAHKIYPQGTRMRRLEARLARQIGGIIAVTRKMADEFVALGVPAARVMVAPDGIRVARFANPPSQAEARAAFGLPADAFIAGYMGRLHTMGMDKGVGSLVEAVAALPDYPIHLMLVGGPMEMAEAYRAQWAKVGLPAARFHSVDHVPAAQVPKALAAFDVAVMPLPWTEHFAYYASPLKLFEYMASGRPVVATDLPSAAEIVRDGESALLVPPSDAEALAAALARLYDAPALRARLAENAQRLVFERYTWAARAKAIHAFILQSLEDAT